MRRCTHREFVGLLLSQKLAAQKGYSHSTLLKFLENEVTHAAWTQGGLPVDAADFPEIEWTRMKETLPLGAFVLPCCRAPAVLKTSINGLRFFAHVSDECATAPETVWHKSGKAAVLAALRSMGIEGGEEIPGRSTNGAKWEADILFTVPGRVIVVELQRSYQTLRDFLRRQQRYADSGVECFWLLRHEGFLTLAKSTAQLVLKRDHGSVFPTKGIGTGTLPELPVPIETGQVQLRISSTRK